MSAETPQPAAAEAPQPPAAPDAAPAKPAGNNQLRIVILVVVVAVVGVGLWLAFGRSNKHHQHNVTTGIGPVAQSARQLSNQASAIFPGRFYWAGPKKNYHYEFQRLAKNGNMYVRYLPKGVPAGGKPGQLLIVATYPFPGAYGRLKKGAKGRVVAGKNGSIIWVKTNDPKNVYIAWKHVPYEVEIYDPNPRRAANIAESGQVTPVS